jgi:hypothetical protein
MKESGLQKYRQLSKEMRALPRQLATLLQDAQPIGPHFLLQSP